MSKEVILIGCDNAAVDFKNIIKNFIENLGFAVEEVGCFSSDDQIYYPYIAEKLCNGIIQSDYQKRGILLCGTGIGMAITANKCKGIRAAVCHDNFSAERAVLSNHTNVLCMGARVIGNELAKKITKEWLSLTFIDGSSTPKVGAIMEVEKRYFK